jgi:hypothetical protein
MLKSPINFGFLEIIYQKSISKMILSTCEFSSNYLKSFLTNQRKFEIQQFNFLLLFYYKLKKSNLLEIIIIVYGKRFLINFLMFFKRFSFITRVNLQETNQIILNGSKPSSYSCRKLHYLWKNTIHGLMRRKRFRHYYPSLHKL